MELRKPEDVMIGNTTLKEILKQKDAHVDLRDTNLSYVNLSYAKLQGADLSRADLSYAYLSHATLLGARLCNAVLYNADLSYANLQHASLESTDLSYAYLRHANLECSDLSYADLRHADLQGANLVGSNSFRAIGDFLEYSRGKILTESIIGYKVCKSHDGSGMPVIVTLEIPRGAIVFSINGKKCRTNKAKVLRVGDGFVDRAYSILRYMTYYVGDEFTVYNFNCEYNVECAEGIHFFMAKEDAIHFAYEFRSRK